MTGTVTYEKLNGIFISPEARKRFADFEAQYSHLRAQEERIMTPAEIRRLPFTTEDHPHHAEWELRRHDINRFMAHLSSKTTPAGILDVGCGNGFLSHLMAEAGHRVIAVDACLFELEQAVKVFGSDNPVWYYADVMTDKLPVKKFDMITFHASFQYFSQPEALLKRCYELLKPGGEIHVRDSPFYKDAAAAERARQNSLQHFQDHGSAGMIHFYHFNTWEVFKNYKHEVRADAGVISKLFGRKRSPFSWIIISKPENQRA